MKNTARIILCLGITVFGGALIYCAGATVAVMSSILFIPVVFFAVVLASRVRRKKVEDQCVTWSFLSVGIWLYASGVFGVCVTSRPGREASGMFGGLFYIWPLAVSAISCLLIPWWLPAKRVTYNER